jgi:hypothetical protein
MADKDTQKKGLMIIGLPLVLSLTLGLAPFSPEPHIVGKIRWLAGGGDGMALLDYGDLLWHGAPWVWLAGALVYVAVRAVRSQGEGRRV